MSTPLIRQRFSGLILMSLSVVVISTSHAQDLRSQLSQAQERKANAQAQGAELERGIAARKEIVARQGEMLGSLKADLIELQQDPDKRKREARRYSELVSRTNDLQRDINEKNLQLFSLENALGRYRLEVELADAKIRDLQKIINRPYPASKRLWRCNFKGALHDSPNDCDRPYLGGRWINTREN